jgi:hypothetical protein
MENPSIMKRMRLRTVISLVTIAVLFPCSGCVSMLRYDGPYEGRVIDAESGKPIEGAVAHGTWSRIHPTPAGRSTEYYDSYETLTDKDGNFRIPGKGLLVFSNIDDMSLTIFKAGYEQRYPINWSGLVQFGKPEKVSWDEVGKGTFKLRRLSMEERRNRGVTLPFGPNKDQKLLIRESNKENLEIGRSRDTLLPEE